MSAKHEASGSIPTEAHISFVQRNLSTKLLLRKMLNIVQVFYLKLHYTIIEQFLVVVKKNLEHSTDDLFASVFRYQTTNLMRKNF